MNNKGMAKLTADIRSFIEEKLDEGYRQFIIFPFGDVGVQVKHFLNNAYGIQEAYIIDNHLYHYNSAIQPMEAIATIDRAPYAVLLSSTNPDIYEELKESLSTYFKAEQIAELPSMRKSMSMPKYHTEIGRYSAGPLCHDNMLIESIGSFCSFAAGTAVAINHETKFLTTHWMMSWGQNYPIPVPYDEAHKGVKTYFRGIQPKDIVSRAKRIRIGNDVWLGQNVIITNYSNIGNGVIAGAGAVITKDVPDYAVVGGVPARIIKYRYTPEQIAGLNQIQWWDWSDEEIRERYDDFYLPIDEFLRKYL